jgi:hypothetical protein
MGKNYTQNNKKHRTHKKKAKHTQQENKHKTNSLKKLIRT